MPPVLLLLFFVIFSFNAVTAALTIPPTAAAFFATWDAAAASPCNFTGVTCDPAGHGAVTVLSVPSLDIATDSVPFDDTCDGLPALVMLSLQRNYWLRGNINRVVRCTGLQELTLVDNGFDGVVPGLSPLTKLHTLNISTNRFTGVFPWASLTAMPGLAVLSLSDNKFSVRTDSFPDEVTKLTNLTVLDLFMTNISGIIPARISNLVNLVHLDLSNNYLTGVIPPEITRLTKLQFLGLYRNSLHGHLPAGFGNLSELRSLT